MISPPHLRTLLLWSGLYAFGLSSPLSAQSSVPDAIPPPECRASVSLGRIVAAEYLRAQNRLFVYATRPEAGLETVVYVDDVSLLARAQLCCGEYGFSLDFERSDGGTPFREEDIVDPADLLTQVREDPRAVSRLLRQHLDTNMLRRIDAGLRADARVVQLLTRALNALRNGADLVRLTAGEPAASDAADPRRNHLFLEDAYPRALRPHVGSRYEIRYPGPHEGALKALFRHTRLEATFNAADTTLKRLLHDVSLASEAGVGATDPLLCAAELEQWAFAGALPATWYRRSNRYFDLRPHSRFERLRGSGIRFEDPEVLVLAGDGVADCQQEAAANLTKRMPALLKHPKHGPHLRRLGAALILNKIISWASALLVPIDLAHLERVPIPIVVNQPPLIVTIPTMVAGLKEVRGTVVSGGLLLGAPPTALGATLSPLTTGSSKNAIAACFATEETQLDGKDVLRVELSAILGLMPPDP